MASTSVAWTPSSSGNRNKWTWSGWVKRSSLGEQVIFGCYQNGSYMTELKFSTSDQIHFEDTYNTNTNGRIITTANFKDTNAWYHIVAVFDNAAGSGASDKIKVYVNGVNQAGAYGNAPTNATTLNSSGQKIQHGQLGAGTNFDGLMSHCHFCDGYAYAASDFGETDSTTGEWKIKTSPSVSYGTNGFWILKDGNSVTDESPNSNNFTVETGTLTKSEDNPSNVFDTINTNFAKTGGVNGRDSNIRIFIDNGATRLSTDVALWTTMLGSIPMFSGKYYWECKRTFEGSPSNHLARVGVEPLDTAGTTLGSPVGTNTNSVNYQSEGGGLKSNSSYSGTYASWQSNNDIVQIAVDMDNYFIYFGKNGTWQNSGDPTSGSSGTGGIALMAGKGYVNGFTVHRGGGSAGGDKSMLKMNFGNGYFQQTAVASAGTNASGLGIFEYDVPTGYTALCTKGLNE